MHARIRGGADKSLAQPTSRCRGTASIVSLERGVCLSAELQVCSCYRGWKETCQATGAISTKRDASCHQVFFLPARQGAEGNSRHFDRNIRGTCTMKLKDILKEERLGKVTKVILFLHDNAPLTGHLQPRRNWPTWASNVLITHPIHRQKLGGPVSTWWFFHLWCPSSWTTQNSDNPWDYWSNSPANLGRPPDFG